MKDGIMEYERSHQRNDSGQQRNERKQQDMEEANKEMPAVASIKAL